VENPNAKATPPEHALRKNNRKVRTRRLCPDQPALQQGHFEAEDDGLWVREFFFSWRKFDNDGFFLFFSGLTAPAFLGPSV